MTRPAVLRRASAVLGAGALLVLAAGCGNGVQTTAAGSAVPAPSQSSVSPTSSTSPTPDDSTTSSSSGSGSSTATSTPSSSSESTSSSPSSTPAGTPTCTLGDLDLGVKTADGGGAAGSVYVLLTFTNTSASSCNLYGYPGVAFVGDKNGTQLGSAATRAENGKAGVVKLASGEATTALLQIANAGNFDAKSCAPTTSDGFRVYPPASTTAAYVPYKTQACQRTDVKQLQVSPVGTSG
ncbi:DUF4232 domain-containing protein [Microlunatus kandeliicorticis]|nr:DUF4232 domain-containing protein [Microlunatus kandeliicorticis]